MGYNKQILSAHGYRHQGKHVFQFIKSRKPAKLAVAPLEEGVKGKVKEDTEIAEKLKGFFPSFFTTEFVGQIHMPGSTFSERRSEEQRQGGSALTN